MVDWWDIGEKWRVAEGKGVENLHKGQQKGREWRDEEIMFEDEQ
jgi:hypothetical protein